MRPLREGKTVKGHNSGGMKLEKEEEKEEQEQEEVEGGKGGN